MYPVNVRPRFSSDFVVGMGEPPKLGGDMLSAQSMLSGLGVLSGSKRRLTPEQIAAAQAARQAALEARAAAKKAAVERQKELAAERTAKQKALLAERRARAEELALQKVKRVEELAAKKAEEKAKLTATYMSQLQEVAAAAGYPPEEVAALLHGKGFKRATQILNKLAALRAQKDVKNYKESIKSLTTGGVLPPAADAAASAATGLAPETPMAAAMMPSMPYAEQEAGLPAYAQQSVEAAAEAAQPPYQLPYNAGIPVAPSAGDEDVVNPEELEGAMIDIGSQPTASISSSELPDEDLQDQSYSPESESDVVSGPLDGSSEMVTPGLPDMAHAGQAGDIEEVIDEIAGQEDPLSRELSRERYPAMLVEDEQIGWPSKVGEGTSEEGGWYGSDPALTSPEEVGGDLSHTPSSMRQRMAKLEAAASESLVMKKRKRRPVVMLDEEPAPKVDQREVRKLVAAKEAAALTRYVIQKHRRGRVGGSFGLGATPFGAQWAVQSSLNAITSRENELMAVSPERLESVRRLNASTYTQIEEARKILEGPSVAVTDELAAVAKFTAAAATYKASLDNALKSLRPKPAPKPKPQPATVAAALPMAVKETVFSKYGMWIIGGGVVLVGGLLALNMMMKRSAK